MKLFSPLSSLARMLLAGMLAASPIVISPVLAQAPAAATLDQQDFEKAMAATDANKLEEAAGLLEGIPVKYPTSLLIPQAKVRLGYVYFRLQQYDKAVKTLQELPTMKNVPPEIQELAASLIPQVLSAKAIAGGPKDPQRKRLFEDAIKGYDAFLKSFPNSDEVESSNYGKAVALYQIERFDEALAPLSGNLTRFPTSASMLDSKYLLALTTGTIANNAALKESKDENAKPDPTIQAKYTAAERMLLEIAGATDVALANDSRFQIGELRFARAGFLKDEKAREALFLSALDVYRVVGAKDLVVAAQKARIERFKAARAAALQQRDAALLKKLGRAIEKENEKLANIEGRPDETIAARIKMGEVFFQIDRLDEARMVLNNVKPLVEDEDQKKAVAYQIALSLAKQNQEAGARNAALVERTETVYNEFKAAYNNDPIGENLPLLIAASFVDAQPKKALQYLEVLDKDFPDSKQFSVIAATLKSAIQIHEEKFDEALASYKALLAKNPPRDTMAMAEFGIATVMQKQKNPEAINMFKKVRDTYAGTKQSVDASFYYPQLLLESGNFKDALPEFQAFVKNNPKNILVPNALFFLAQAQVQSGPKFTADALATFKRVATEFPNEPVAPFTYFSRAQILQQEGKTEEVVALMREFMQKYPDKETLFQAYQFVAQLLVVQKKVEEAIATYEEYAKLKPQDPQAAQALLQVGIHWKELTEGIGRYSLLPPDQQELWVKNLDKSMKAGERVIREHPEAPQVALALALLLDNFKLRIGARSGSGGSLAKEADIEPYFSKLAEEFKDKPSTRSKIIFTLAGTLMEKEKEKALKLMTDAYDPANKYAPEDMDLYGTGLIDQKKYDDAVKLYNKLAADYPIPAAAADPTKAPRDIQEAQSMALYGLGKVLQDQNKKAEAKVKFDELEKNYGWSPKMLAAGLGIAEALYQEQKYDDALKRLGPIVRASKAPAELRARAMLLLATVLEAQKNYDDAIDNYLKIPAFYSGVPKIAAEGLWRGARLLEQQSTGEIPIPVPTPKPAPGKKPAAGATPAAPAAPAPGSEVAAAGAK